MPSFPPGVKKKKRTPASSLCNSDTELKMSWTYTTLLALLTVLLALSLSPEADSAAVSSSTGSGKDPQGPLKKIFMKEADASNFFQQRSRRGVKSQDEID
eukprot:superscaffoldBa00005469_g20384